MGKEKAPFMKRTAVCFFLVFSMIFCRVGYLSVVAFDDHYEKAYSPQKKTLLLEPNRGTVRDRFNIPLATNKVQYNAAVRYEGIRQIPRVRWEIDTKGKRKRVLARVRYIEKLSAFLGAMLDICPQEIEDVIHAEASLFPSTSFVLKEDISEELYYQLKMCEKDWLGIDMQLGTKRVYPQGKVACDVIGYTGAISQEEYRNIAGEIHDLSHYLQEVAKGKPAVLPKGFDSPDAVQTRLHELKKTAYSINDLVGKCGVEATFDEVLRGKRGKEFYEVDIKGNTLRKLPASQSAMPGKRLILSLSLELQREAEELLAECELLQDARDHVRGEIRDHPRQRGGAIVAMIPTTGEIVALASYPRFDPNDLVPAKTPTKRREQRKNIYKWFENIHHISAIWDGKLPMERELFSSTREGYFLETTPLTWESYLDLILPQNSPVRQSLDKVGTLGQAGKLFDDLEEVRILLHKESLARTLDALYSCDHQEYSSMIETRRQEIDPYFLEIDHHKDRILFVDLLRLVAYTEVLPPPLLYKMKEVTLSEQHAFAQTVARLIDPIEECVKNAFRADQFSAWRREEFPDFLRAKRRVEREHKQYARPYTTYLRREEKGRFAKIWEETKSANLCTFLRGKRAEKCAYADALIKLKGVLTDPKLDALFKKVEGLSEEEVIAYLLSLRPFANLTRPLLGSYPYVRSLKGAQTEKHLAAAFYPHSGFGYGRSQAFRQATPMGSIFKLIPAYAALMQKFSEGETDLNPLTVIDEMQWASFKGSRNQVLGRHTDGQVIHRQYKGGRLPRAYPGIGNIDLVKAIERSSNIYFSLLAGDVLESPSTLINSALDFGLGQPTGVEIPGEYRGMLPSDVTHNKTGLYSFAIGQHSLVATPLQAATALSAIVNGGTLFRPMIAKLSATKDDAQDGQIAFHAPVIRKVLPMPKEVQSLLVKGMYQVTNGERGSARLARIRKSFQPPAAYESYRRLCSEMLGKTGTAEILYKGTIDAATPPKLEKHVWFQGVSFENNDWEKPELVVVVFQRFGSAGKQGGPIAARIIERWREIKRLHEISTLDELASHSIYP